VSAIPADAAAGRKPKFLDQRVKASLTRQEWRELIHYVYVLRSLKDNGFYIGYSANLRKRFSEHVTGGSFATSHRGPWQLIYYEAYLNQADALGRERYLKSGAGRRFLKAQLRHYLSDESLSWKRVAKLLRVTLMCSTGRALA